MVPSVLKPIVATEEGNEARDVFFAGDAEKGAGAFDVGADHSVGVADPEAVVSGDRAVMASTMSEMALRQGVWFEQIADDGFGRPIRETRSWMAGEITAPAAGRRRVQRRRRPVRGDVTRRRILWRR